MPFFSQVRVEHQQQHQQSFAAKAIKDVINDPENRQPMSQAVKSDEPYAVETLPSVSTGAVAEAPSKTRWVGLGDKKQGRTAVLLALMNAKKL